MQFYLVRSGLVDLPGGSSGTGIFTVAGQVGYYWSLRSGTTTNAYDVTFGFGVYPSNSLNSRYAGFPPSAALVLY